LNLGYLAQIASIVRFAEISRTRAHSLSGGESPTLLPRSKRIVNDTTLKVRISAKLPSESLGKKENKRYLIAPLEEARCLD
jgi:hypothetical protein